MPYTNNYMTLINVWKVFINTFKRNQSLWSDRISKARRCKLQLYTYNCCSNIIEQILHFFFQFRPKLSNEFFLRTFNSSLMFPSHWSISRLGENSARFPQSLILHNVYKVKRSSHVRCKLEFYYFVDSQLKFSILVVCQ